MLSSGLTVGSRLIVGAGKSDSYAALRGDIFRLVEHAQEEVGAEFNILDPAVRRKRPQPARGGEPAERIEADFLALIGPFAFQQVRQRCGSGKRQSFQKIDDPGRDE